MALQLLLSHPSKGEKPNVFALKRLGILLWLLDLHLFCDRTSWPYITFVISYIRNITVSGYQRQYHWLHSIAGSPSSMGKDLHCMCHLKTYSTTCSISKKRQIYFPFSSNKSAPQWTCFVHLVSKTLNTNITSNLFLLCTPHGRPDAECSVSPWINSFITVHLVICSSDTNSTLGHGPKGWSTFARGNNSTRHVRFFKCRSSGKLPYLFGTRKTQ